VYDIYMINKESNLWRYEELEAIQELFKKPNYQKIYWHKFTRGSELALENATNKDFVKHFDNETSFYDHFRNSIKVFGAFITNPFFRWNFGEKEKESRLALKTARKLEEALTPFTTVSIGRANLNYFDNINSIGLRKRENKLIIRMSVAEAWLDVLIPEETNQHYNANNVEIEELDPKVLEIVNVDFRDISAFKTLLDTIYQFVLAPSIYSKLVISNNNLASVISDYSFEKISEINELSIGEYRKKTKFKKIVDNEVLAAALTLIDKFGFNHNNKYIYLEAK